MGLFSQLKSKERSQKGVALVAVMIILGILIIIALAFYALGAYEAGLYERRRELEVAFCRAESGVERARWVLLETGSKSAALIDSAGINVYEVVEINPSGEVVNQGIDQIDFMHHVRVRSQGIEKGQVRELVVEFAPGLRYAVATSQHITFHGGSNDWSPPDVIDIVNDVYIDGGLLYDHHINHPDWPYKYDWARPDTVLIPDYLKTMPNFQAYFQPMATPGHVYLPPANKFWGDPGGGNPWVELPNNTIAFVQGNVDISENVIERWDTTSVDVTICATGNITVTNGKNDDDDRLVLISLGNIIFEGSGADKSLNAVVATGSEVWTTGLTGGGAGGGEGGIHGVVLVCKNIDMRGYDPAEIYPFRRGWTITCRIETVLLNGGIIVLPALNWGPLMDLHRTSWAEVPPV
jgi:hypothetical protein